MSTQQLLRSGPVFKSALIALVLTFLLGPEPVLAEGAGLEGVALPRRRIRWSMGIIRRAMTPILTQAMPITSTTRLLPAISVPWLPIQSRKSP